MNQYGIDINTLDKFIARPAPETRDWGEHSILVSEPMFRLERASVLPGKIATIETADDFEMTLWIEEGSGSVEGVALTAHEKVTIAPHKSCSVTTEVGLVAYLFCGPAEEAGEHLAKGTSSDFRDKYWGTIESITSKGYAAKRMLVKKGKYASLEYHCDKMEAYYIHSGKLLLRLRAGRGEDRFFPLETGMTAFTPRGLMHQRGGIEDTVIMEISTRDSDGDSFLVEDGQTTPMPNLPA